MSSSSRTLLEVFGHIVFRFTKGVSEQYNSQEPEYMAESFGYSPLESTGQEWYRHGDPDEECIYQEYSDRETTTLDYRAQSNGLAIRVVNACSTEENDESQEDHEDEDGGMAWKRLRPSALRTVCKSMYIGALISLLTATIIGSVYMLIYYLCFKTINNCEFYPKRSIPVKIQWMRSISAAVACVFLHISFFVYTLFLLRPHQLKGIKQKLILVACLAYFLDTTYRLALQGLGISHSKLSTLQKLPLNVLFFMSVCGQAYLLTSHFRLLRTWRQKIALGLQMTVPFCSIIIIAVAVVSIIYPLYNKQSEESVLPLVIALFAPLIGVLFKVVSRILVQRQESITHPGYSCVLLAPLYCVSAIMFRVLQADLDSLQYMVVLGLIHGATEVIERSTMVLIDHICHVICKRTSAPWGSFRSPRRERLMADIAIMSMLFESTAIVSVNGFLYLYQYVYLKNDSLLELLQSFAISTSVQLLIEWFFTSVSLAIETRYQNIAVMAVWRRRWKRHILMALVTTMSSGLWFSSNLLDMAHEHFKEPLNQPCDMPFA